MRPGIPWGDFIVPVVVQRVGSEFTVNAGSSSTENFTTYYTQNLAAFSNGDLAFMWDGFSGGSYGSRLQVQTSAGVAVSSEFVLSGQQMDAVALLSTGNLAVTYMSGTAAYAEVLDSTGAVVISPFQVNTTAANSSFHIAPLSGGAFVEIWRNNVGFADFDGQIISSTGAKVGSEFTVNSVASTATNSPTDAVAPLSGGGFVAVWSNNTASSTGADIKAQIFTSAGAKVGSEFLVNTSTTGDQVVPVAASLQTGGFVVVWQDLSNYSVHGQVFDSSGAKVGSELTISPSGHSSEAPSVATLANGDFVVSWTNDDTFADGSGQGGLRPGLRRHGPSRHVEVRGRKRDRQQPVRIDGRRHLQRLRR